MLDRVDRIAGALLLGVALFGCDPAPSPSGPGPQGGNQPPGLLATSTALRVVDPVVPAADLAALVRDNADAALELLRRSGDPQKSFALSPQSLQLALAMTFEGARGTTESQMASALRWSLPKANLHAAFNALDQQLGTRTSSADIKIHTVNALFGQTSFQFQQPFVDTVAAFYGAPLSRLDFAANPSAARDAINSWVKTETDGELPELLAPDDIDSNTALALVNAIRLMAQWKVKFPQQNTQPAPFTHLDGTSTMLPTMVLAASFNLARGADWDAVELLYQGDAVSMLVVLPRPDAFTTFVAGLDHAGLAAIDDSLAPANVSLALPRFDLRSALPAAPVLHAMGMIDAFASGTADLSGIGGAPGDLYVSKVVHQAVVQVDEDGTRAAASSAVVVGVRGAAPERFAVDRPFLFFIRDKATGAILFLGRFMGT